MYWGADWYGEANIESLDEKIETLDAKLSGDVINTYERVDKEIANWEKCHEEEKKKLEELFADNKRKIKDVESRMLDQQKMIQQGRISFQMWRMWQVFSKETRKKKAH